MTCAAMAPGLTCGVFLASHDGGKATALTSADVRKAPCKHGMKRRPRGVIISAQRSFAGNLQAMFRALC
jgi:hypothetical protein